LKFKLEISLLLLSIAMYIASGVCYSYEKAAMTAVVNYPYRIYVFPLIGVSSAFMVIAGFLISRRKSSIL
jgi:hypothetical protein